PVRLHAAVRRARGPLQALPRARPRRARLPVRPVRAPGAGDGRRDRELLRVALRRDVPDAREGGGERRRRPPALRAPQGGGAGPARHEVDQVELHQVPRRPRRQGGGALRPERRSGEDRAGYRAAAAERLSRNAACGGRANLVRRGSFLGLASYWISCFTSRSARLRSLRPVLTWTVSTTWLGASPYSTVAPPSPSASLPERVF